MFWHTYIFFLFRIIPRIYVHVLQIIKERQNYKLAKNSYIFKNIYC